MLPWLDWKKNSIWLKGDDFDTVWSIICGVTGPIHIPLSVIVKDYETWWIRIIFNLTFDDDIFIVKQSRTAWL